MSSVIVISDDERDEPDVINRPNLSSPIPPERFLGNKFSDGEQAKVSLKIGPPRQKKRRRISDSGGEPVEAKGVPKVKKTKREEHKAVSVICSTVAAPCVDWIFPHVFGPKSSSP